MSLQTRMQAKDQGNKIRESAAIKLYRDDKIYRADRLVDAWSQIPEIGEGLRDMPLTESRNVAINLDRQTAFMQNLRESQMATALNDFTPENMLRLVRLAMPNIIRNKLFTEFALETTKDSIKYIRPFFAKTANGKELKDKSPAYNGQADDGDPWGYDTPKGYDNGSLNADDYRKALYEETRDRYTQELANPVLMTKKLSAGGTASVIANFYAADMTGSPTEADILSQKWGANGSKFVDGYINIYFGNPASKAGKTGGIEKNVIAVQDRESKAFFCPAGASVVRTIDPTNPGKQTFAITLTGDLKDLYDADADNELFIFGRYDSESDFEGDYLGEVEIRMAEYTFKPSATSIGVSWSQLTELTLDTSFNVSAEEYLVTYASQEIRAALDYRAIKLAYSIAKTNTQHNAKYLYVFDAGYNTTNIAVGSTGTKEGYIHNAQTFTSAISAIGDVMFDEINRGGVSRIVGGPSAVSYTELMGGYSTKGKQGNVGAHQFGELNGIPLFKVPSAIIPTDELLTIWKNDECENDVSIAFGTLVPFFSTGIIQRKNFYKEAGIATWGDWQCLNRRYLALIQIKNLKDSNV